MRVGRHDQIEADQTEHQHEGEDVEPAPEGHATFDQICVVAVSPPAAMDPAAHAAGGAVWIKLQLQRVIEVDEADTVKNQEADHVAREQERKIQPDLFSVQIVVHPRKHIRPAKKERQKQHEGQGKKTGECFGQTGQGATPTGLGHMHYSREDHGPLRNPRPKQKVDQIYNYIPDFGGFLVKANSEGQPGPGDYDRSHADGANMLAEDLDPHGGIVMWRAFVYSHSLDQLYLIDPVRSGH